MYSESSEIRDLTEVAAMTAISVLLLIFYRYVPALGSVLTFFSSLPIIYTTVNKKLGHIVMQIVATVIVIFLLTGDPRLLLLFVTDFLTIGISLGLGIRYNLGTMNTVALSTLVVSTVFFAGLLVLKEVGFDLQKDLVALVDKMLDMMKAGAKMEQANIEIMRQSLYKTVKIGFPGLVFSANLIHVTASYLVAYSVLRKVRARVEKLDLLKVKPNGVLIWALIISLVFALPWLKTFGAAFYNISYNLRIILFAAFTLIGISIFNFYLSKTKLNNFLKIVLNFIIITQLWWVLAAIAVFDYWLNFRKV